MNDDLKQQMAKLELMASGRPTGLNSIGTDFSSMVTDVSPLNSTDVHSPNTGDKDEDTMEVMAGYPDWWYRMSELCIKETLAEEDKRVMNFINQAITPDQVATCANS